MVGWLVGWLVGSFVRCFVVGSFVGWLVRSLVCWFVGYLVGSLVAWLFGCLVRWFVGSLVGYLVVIYSNSQLLTSCQNRTIKRQKSATEHLNGNSDAQFYKLSHQNRSSHTLNTNPQKLLKLRGGHVRTF